MARVPRRNGKTTLGTVIGLIPARGGSKGIPGKNLTTLAGKPLLAYTAEAALNAPRLSKVLVSTDDDEIANAARALGLDVPFLRPANLAGDDTPMVPVIAHALDHLEKTGNSIDTVVLLQPTSPLRTAHHIEDALDLMVVHDAQTVVSVVQVPHHFTPASIMVSNGGILKPYEPGPMILRRQDKPTLYARNGPAVLVAKSEIVRQGQLYGNPTIGYEMDEYASIDIDTNDDLWLAEQVLNRRT